MYEEYKKYIIDDLFFRPFGDHGIGHTRRVLYLALKLAENYNLDENSKSVLAFACCYHDIGRTNDWTDDEHGKKSAEKALLLGLNDKCGLNSKDLERALDLIVFHSLDDDTWAGDQNDLLLYQILKDADALDRLRFNDLDINYLRLAKSREMIDLEFSLLRADGVVNE